MSSTAEKDKDNKGGPARHRPAPTATAAFVSTPRLMAFTLRPVCAQNGEARQLRQRAGLGLARPCVRPCGVVSARGSSWRRSGLGADVVRRGRRRASSAPDGPDDARDDVEGEEKPNGTDDEHGPADCAAAVLGSGRLRSPRASRRRAANMDDVTAGPTARGRRRLGLESGLAAGTGDHGHERSIARGCPEPGSWPPMRFSTPAESGVGPQ